MVILSLRDDPSLPLGQQFVSKQTFQAHPGIFHMNFYRTKCHKSMQNSALLGRSTPAPAQSQRVHHHCCYQRSPKSVRAISCGPS